MDAHTESLAGLPQAKEWITHFARQLPARHTPAGLGAAFATAALRAKAWLRERVAQSSTSAAGSRSVGWVALLSTSIVDAHHRRTQATGPDRDAIDREIAWCVRTIDAKLAVLLDMTAARLDIGRLVSIMAERWVTYTQQRHNEAALTAVLAAQRAYTVRVEQLSTLPRGGPS
ncbi:hypothetical protein [Nocardia sp. R7R-8]|uniref:hypothetical protein n=1 Tax=Nocardia sp. R7R-8 TaxID=3459304 RepID=UPI00403DB951